MRRYIRKIRKKYRKIKKQIIKKINTRQKEKYRAYVNSQLPTINTETEGRINNNLIVFESFFGRSISDNPKAIYDGIDKEKYDCVFCVNNLENQQELFPDIKMIKRYTVEYFTTLRQAKLIITNQRLPKDFVKQPNQVVIQTWHGTPLKKLVHDLTTFDMPSADSIEEYFEMFDNEVPRWDYMYSTCPYTTEKMRSAFLFEKEMLEIGFPRNEFLYTHTKEDIALVKKELGIEPDKKIILYAPTYRDNLNHGMGKYYFNTELDFEKLKEAFPDHEILIRYHYIVSKSQDFKNENVINVTKYPNINDLFIISDILITDYSSVFFDYSILNRPFFFFAQDIEEYEGELRGFYLDYFKDLVTTPVDNTDDLIELIRNKDEYDFTAFKEKYNPEQNINCMVKTNELINQIMNKEK